MSSRTDGRVIKYTYIYTHICSIYKEGMELNSHEFGMTQVPNPKFCAISPKDFSALMKTKFGPKEENEQVLKTKTGLINSM